MSPSILTHVNQYCELYHFDYSNLVSTQVHLHHIHVEIIDISKVSKSDWCDKFNHFDNDR